MEMERKCKCLIEDRLLQYFLLSFILYSVSRPAWNICVKMTKNEVLKVIKYV